jgi:hypothetical protein
MRADLRHPRLNSVINKPDIPTIRQDSMHRHIRDESQYEHIKYLFFSKSFESIKPFKIRGVPQITRCYGIGILTDTNRYYYSEIHTRHNDLTTFNIKLFKKTILTHYKIDKDTQIRYWGNIKKNEPIREFMEIVVSAVHGKTRTIQEMPMYRIINRAYNYVRPLKGYSGFTKFHRKKLIKRLLEMDRFEFITEPDWYAKLQLKRKRSRDAYMMCALGIVYLGVRDYLWSLEKKYKQRRIERKKAKDEAEKMYNITNNQEKKDSEKE